MNNSNNSVREDDDVNDNDNNNDEDNESSSSSSDVVFVYTQGPPENNLLLNTTRVRVLDPTTTTIEEGALANCHSLVHVDLEAASSLRLIQRAAFYNCPALVDIQIPPTVERIEADAFAWCRSLTTIRFHETHEQSASLQYIGKHAFVGTSLLSIILPRSVHTIDDEAFDGCHLLSHLQLKEGLVSIGSRAFASCARLAQIVIPSSVDSMGSGALAWCKSLRWVHLPEHQNGLLKNGLLKEISDNMLERCLALEYIAIPKTMDTIGNRAFEYCTQLETVQFFIDGTANLVSIRYRAFAGCTNLQHLIGLSALPSLVSIGEAAFVECKFLVEVQLPQSLKHLGGYAFAECHALESVSFANHSLQEIPLGCFQGCSSLTEVNLPQGLEAIGDHAFAYCESLSAISLPDSLYMIGRSFHECTNLLGVEIPESADFIMTYRPPCFAACSSLVTVSLPLSLDQSMVHAFSDCPRLLQKLEEEGGKDGGGGGGQSPHLRDRFCNLPVHNVCYHASSTTVDGLVQALDSMNPVVNEDDADDSKEKNFLVDAYGMTPCHVVATSFHLRLDIFVMLLDRYPTKILWMRDNHKCSAMDYMLVHRSSRAIPLIQHALQIAIGCWMNDWGLETWRLELRQLVEESIPWDTNVETRRQQLLKVLDRLESYRELEVTSIMELVLWKMTTNQQQQFPAQEDAPPTYASPTISPSPERRENHRLLCGANVVLPNVMEYLWNNGTFREAVYWI